MLYLDVNAHALIQGAAKKLEPQFQPPTWAMFVKTGVHKERPPVQDNWWYLRSAAILRTVAVIGPIGTNKLRVKYGGKQNRGHKPSRFARGSGSVIRKSLQQLEAAGLITHTQIGAHKGRIITKEGIALLNSVAKEVKAQAQAQKAANGETVSEKPAKKAPAKAKKVAAQSTPAVEAEE